MLVFLADSQPIFQIGLKSLLESSQDKFEIELLSNGEELLERVKVRCPDLVILDIDLVGKNSLKVCRELSRSKRAIHIIILAGLNVPELAGLAFLNGAKGYLLKESTPRELFDCIKTVLDGKMYVANSIRAQQQTEDCNQQVSVGEMLQELTRTELKTLKLVAQRKSSREIADLLFVSVKSVENYRSRICKKLNINGMNNALLQWVVEYKSVINYV